MIFIKCSSLLYILVTLFWHGILVSQEFPHEEMEKECQSCHNAEDWLDITFKHSDTQFPLTVKHQGIPCKNCHDIKNFQNSTGDCRGCHTDVHQGRLGPWCESCHTPVSWNVIDPVIAHANTTFPLLGKHARLDCNGCHYTEIEGEFSPLKSECFSCHSEDYNRVQSPNHMSSGFPLTCETCHGFFSWKPAQFREHDGIFPIFSGNHSGEWNECSDCHIIPGNFQVFSCLNCHEHSRDKMDQEHREVPGYIYESNACYNCHPTGSTGD